MTERVSGSDGSCLMCQNRDWRLVIRSEDVEYKCKPGTFDVVECTKCGHIYVHPLPQYSEIASLYPNTYYTVNKKSPLHLDGAIYEKNWVRTRGNYGVHCRVLIFDRLSMLALGR